MAYTGRILLSLGRPQQIKDLRAALNCLFKIGSELLVEGLEDRLVLRSINTAKSAFFAVTFSSSFFDDYQVHGSEVVQSAVLLKHVLATFRTHKINRMTLDMDADQSMLTVTVVGENKITKTYHLECMNSEILNATVDKDSCPTQVIAEAGELNKLLSSFQSGLDEITIIANPENLASAASMHRACQLQSFYDPEKARSKDNLHTSLEVDTRSLFVGYQHRSANPSDVTFNVKDFRSMVALCEHMGVNIILRFDEAGMPLVAEPYLQGGSDARFRAELVLATLMESQLSAATAHPAADAGAQPSPLPNLQGQHWQGQQAQQQQQPMQHEQRTPVGAAARAWDHMPPPSTGGPAWTGTDAGTSGHQPGPSAPRTGSGGGAVRFRQDDGDMMHQRRHGDETAGFEADDAGDDEHFGYGDGDAGGGGDEPGYEEGAGGAAPGPAAADAAMGESPDPTELPRGPSPLRAPPQHYEQAAGTGWQPSPCVDASGHIAPAQPAHSWRHTPVEQQQQQQHQQQYFPPGGLSSALHATLSPTPRRTSGASPRAYPTLQDLVAAPLPSFLGGGTAAGGGYGSAGAHTAPGSGAGSGAAAAGSYGTAAAGAHAAPPPAWNAGTSASAAGSHAPAVAGLVLGSHSGSAGFGPSPAEGRLGLAYLNSGATAPTLGGGSGAAAPDAYRTASAANYPAAAEGRLGLSYLNSGASAPSLGGGSGAAVPDAYRAAAAASYPAAAPAAPVPAPGGAAAAAAGGSYFAAATPYQLGAGGEGGEDEGDDEDVLPATPSDDGHGPEGQAAGMLYD